MMLSVLSFPEIVSAASECPSHRLGGLEAVLVPGGFLESPEAAELGRGIRVESQEPVVDGEAVPSGPEGALTILATAFMESAPAAFRVLPESSPIRLRVVAAADDYGLVVDVGHERVLLTILEREQLVKVADDLVSAHSTLGPMMAHGGGEEAFPVEGLDGQTLTRLLAARP